jgi:hypothetical protein
MRYGLWQHHNKTQDFSKHIIHKRWKPQIIFSNVRNAQDVVRLVKSMRKLQLQQRH